LSQTRQQPGRSGNGSRRKDGLLTTGDMARLSNNTLRTVRFYEESGLLTPVQRTDGGHRLFPRRELGKLQLISDLRAAGFSLEEIKEVLEVKQSSSSGAAASRGVVERLDRHIGSMSERIALLERLLAELQRTRQLLAECQTCSDGDRFPDGCSTCEVMSDAEIPNAAGVLWRVER
jgi:DNA-binding transcriptional MerR regulator